MFLMDKINTIEGDEKMKGREKAMKKSWEKKDW
jgi:hypothetical protein